MRITFEADTVLNLKGHLEIILIYHKAILHYTILSTFGIICSTNPSKEQE